MLKWLLASRRLRVFFCWMLVILAWEGAYRTIGWKAHLFPAPSHVLDATAGMLGRPTHFSAPIKGGWLGNVIGDSSDSPPIYRSELVVAVFTSVTRLLIGFTISLLLGLALGLAMWRFKFVDDMLGPLFLGLQTLPSVCWVPVAILAISYSETGMLFVLVMGSFFAIAISLRDGLRATPPIYRAAGRVFGARGLNFYLHVMLPSGLPALAGSLRSGFSFAWRSLMGGELIFALKRHGLGHLLHAGREYGGIEQVVAVMIVMVMIGMAADRLAFARIERRVQQRFGFTH